MGRGAEAVPLEGEGADPARRQARCGASAAAAYEGLEGVRVRGSARDGRTRGPLRGPPAARPLPLHVRAEPGRRLRRLLHVHRSGRPPRSPPRPGRHLRDHLAGAVRQARAIPAPAGMGTLLVLVGRRGLRRRLRHLSAGAEGGRLPGRRGLRAERLPARRRRRLPHVRDAQPRRRDHRTGLELPRSGALRAPGDLGGLAGRLPPGRALYVVATPRRIRGGTMSERDGYRHGVPCFGLGVFPDPDASASFYSELFGWETEDLMPADDLGSYHVCRLRGRDVAAIVSQHGAPAPPRAVWATLIWVDAANEAAAKAKAVGGEVIGEPFDSPGAWRLVDERALLPRSRRREALLRRALRLGHQVVRHGRSRDVDVDRPRLRRRRTAAARPSRRGRDHVPAHRGRGRSRAALERRLLGRERRRGLREGCGARWGGPHGPLRRPEHGASSVRRGRPAGREPLAHPAARCGLTAPGQSSHSRPGIRVVISCRSQPLPSGSLNDAYAKYERPGKSNPAGFGASSTSLTSTPRLMRSSRAASMSVTARISLSTDPGSISVNG